MNCMRCGREISAEDVFCPECLDDMARHPVEPGTPVRLPPAAITGGAVRRGSQPKKVRKPEEQIRGLHRLVAWLVVVILLLTLAFGITTGILVHMLKEKDREYESGTNFGSKDDGLAVQIVSRETV